MRAINRYDIGKVFSYYLTYYCKVHYVVHVNALVEQYDCNFDSSKVNNHIIIHNNFVYRYSLAPVKFLVPCLEE